MQDQRRGFWPFAFWCLITAVVLAAATQLQSSDFNIVVRTVALGAAAALIAVPLGAFLAWTASKRGVVPMLARMFCLFGILLPVFAQVSSWDAAFGKLGWITSASGETLKPIIGRWQAAIWIHAMIATPQIALLFLAAIRSGRLAWQDALELESPPLLAAMRSGWWRFSPFVFAAILWTIVSAAREIGVTDIYQIGTLAEQVYLGYSLGQLGSIGTVWTADQIAQAERLGVAVSLLIVAWMAGTATVAFLHAAASRQPRFATANRQSEKVTAGQSACCCIVLLLLVAVPVANLLVKVGFTVVQENGQPTATWSLDGARFAIQKIVTNFQSEFRWTALIAIGSTLLITAIAIPLTWAANRSRGAGICLAVAFGILVAIPGPSIGIGIGRTFTNLNFSWTNYLYDRTIFAPVIANTLYCLPLALLFHYFLASQASTSERELARIDGIKGIGAIWLLNLRPRWKSHLICTLLVLAISFGELSATQMVLPPGIDTVSRLALGLLHSGVSETVAALTLVSLVPILAVAAFTEFLVWHAKLGD